MELDEIRNKVKQKISELGLTIEIDKFDKSDKELEILIHGCKDCDDLPQQDNDIDPQFTNFMNEIFDPWEFTQYSSNYWNGNVFHGSIKISID